mmetsp:Transcript_5480/g.18396  ORF Transcript_5480/g.18396 Transcript_5480/m.18396 type:complete len:295 (-) Transcript_5480:119-1003(-)
MGHTSLEEFCYVQLSRNTQKLAPRGAPSASPSQTEPLTAPTGRPYRSSVTRKGSGAPGSKPSSGTAPCPSSAPDECFFTSPSLLQRPDRSARSSGRRRSCAGRTANVRTGAAFGSNRIGESADQPPRASAALSLRGWSSSSPWRERESGTASSAGAAASSAAQAAPDSCSSTSSRRRVSASEARSGCSKARATPLPAPDATARASASARRRPCGAAESSAKCASVPAQLAPRLASSARPSSARHGEQGGHSASCASAAEGATSKAARSGVWSDETRDGSVAYSSGVTLPGRRER